MISYLDYIDVLDKLDIKLYDFQKRISYIRLLNLKSDKNIQIGGTEINLYNKDSYIYDGNNENKSDKSDILLSNINNKINKFQLENIILKLLNKEFNIANILYNNYCL